MCACQAELCHYILHVILSCLLRFFLLIFLFVVFFFTYCFLEIISFILLCLFVLYFRVLRTTSPWLPQEQKISYKIKESKTRDTFAGSCFIFTILFFSLTLANTRTIYVYSHFTFLSFLLWSFVPLFIYLFITNCNISPMHF